MNWKLNGMDLNTIWTSPIYFILGYFIGTIIYSRIYITLFRNGNTVFVNKNGNEVELKRFGTSVIADYMGIKHSIIQFTVDFFKPFLLFWAIIYPLSTYVNVFSTAIIGFGFLGIIVGHNWPVWWKWKGGVGVASGVGILFLFNWFAGLIGFLFWLVVATISRSSALGGAIGALIGISLTFIPSLSTNQIMTNSLVINTGLGGVAQIIYPFSLALIVMAIKFNYGSSENKRSFLKLLGLRKK